MTPAEELLEIRCNGETVRFPRRLLDKYDVAGPRYTSYPTAPEWRDDFGAADMEEALVASNAGGRGISLYVHIPFCERLCLYCGCNVVIRKDHAVAKPYLARLVAEIRSVSRLLDASRPLAQLHWGGGTPTYLSPGEMEELFVAVRGHFRVAPEAELGLEIDPRVTTAAHVRTLGRLGFNRASIGIQDFDPVVQRTIRRVQSFEATRELFELCRAEGFRSVNADLIYGLPHQTPAGFAVTIDRLLDLRPDRVALFSYAHVPWLKKQQGSFARHLPSAIEKFELFRLGLERLTAAGYRFIGFDHFARPDDELCVAQRDRTLTRNFQGYATGGGLDLVAIGVSGISAVGDVYAQSLRDLPSWERAIDDARLPTMRGIRLDADDLLRRDVILRLLCHCRLRKAEIEERHGIRFDETFAAELPRLVELEADGLLELDGDEIRVPLLGRLFLRVIGMAFDGYLARRTDPASRPLFSRVV